MPKAQTAEVIHRFNEVFQTHDAAALGDLIAEDCVLEDVQPAPDGTRYEGRSAVIAFWSALATDGATSFDLEDVLVSGERAVIRWRARSGDGSVRGVNLMHVRDGLIVEALGYVKA